MPTPHQSLPGGYDELSKAAITLAMPQVLVLLGLGATAAPLEALDPLPVDLPATVHHADLLFRTPGGLIIHVEIQQRADPEMGRRMAEYGIRLAGVHPGRGPDAAIQIVVQVKDPPMPVSWTWAGIRASYHLLHIPSLDPAALLATPALAPFAVVTGGAEVVADMSAALADIDDEALQWSLAVLAVRLAPDLTDIILEQLRRDHMSTEIIVEHLMTTDFGHTIHEQGIEQGLEQGIEQGAAAERRSAVMAILHHRFPVADGHRIARTAGRLAGNSPATALDDAFALEDLDA